MTTCRCTEQGYLRDLSPDGYCDRWGGVEDLPEWAIEKLRNKTCIAPTLDEKVG